MTWIRDIDGDLVNLDYVRQVNSSMIDSDDEETEFAVFAVLEQQDVEGENFTVILCRGTEAECHEYRDKLFAKLPKVTP